MQERTNSVIIFACQFSTKLKQNLPLTSNLKIISSLFSCFWHHSCGFFKGCVVYLRFEKPRSSHMFRALIRIGGLLQTSNFFFRWK